MNFPIRPSGVIPVDVPNRVPNLKGAGVGGRVDTCQGSPSSGQGVVPARREVCRSTVDLRQGVNRDMPAMLVGVYGSDLKRVLGRGEIVAGYDGHEVSRVRGDLAPGTYWVCVKARGGVDSGGTGCMSALRSIL